MVPCEMNPQVSSVFPRQTLKLKFRYFGEISTLAAPNVVKMTTFGAASDENVNKMT